jgi:hypothetical protein
VIGDGRRGHHKLRLPTLQGLECIASDPIPALHRMEAHLQRATRNAQHETHATCSIMVARRPKRHGIP